MIELKDVPLFSSSPVSVTFPAECLTAVFGGSPENKTALLEAILGFHPVVSGFVSLFDEVVTSFSAPFLRQQVAYIPRDTSFATTTLYQVVQAFVGLPICRETEMKHRLTLEALVSECISMGLSEELLKKKSSEVPPGVRRKVLWAATVLRKCPVVLVDGLSDAANEEWQLLESFAHAGSCVVLCTNSETVASKADRMWRISLQP